MAFIVMENRAFRVTESVREIKQIITTGYDFFYVTEKITLDGNMNNNTTINYQNVFINKRYIIEIHD